MRISPVVIFLLFSAQAPAFGADRAREPILPLPLEAPAVNKGVVELGEKLFSEKKLSKDNSISCASCHNLGTNGADTQVVSRGIKGALGEINSPTVFNSGFNFRQFWNGSAHSLEDQIDGPIKHPKEMGSSWIEIADKLARDPDYARMFGQSYPDGVTPANIKNAIASFERTLITHNAPFDRYLRGDNQAITELEKRGYAQFKAYGCVACHQGINVGGNMFQTMGVMGNYFQDRGTEITPADLGLFTETKKESDRHLFKVPSLRNVALTAPYFHDGSAKTLSAAIATMAKYQLGRPLPKEDLKAIEAFLKTLTGKTPSLPSKGKK